MKGYRNVGPIRQNGSLLSSGKHGGRPSYFRDKVTPVRKAGLKVTKSEQSEKGNEHDAGTMGSDSGL